MGRKHMPIYFLFPVINFSRTFCDWVVFNTSFSVVSGPLNSTELQVITQPEVHNRGQHYSRTGPMLKETRILLEDFYRPYNQQLANLVNDPDLLWME